MFGLLIFWYLAVRVLGLGFGIGGPRISRPASSILAKPRQNGQPTPSLANLGKLGRALPGFAKPGQAGPGLAMRGQASPGLAMAWPSLARPVQAWP